MPDPSLIHQTVQAAGDSPIVSDPTGWVGAIAALPFVGWWVYRIYMRVRSKDGLEIVKDRAETDIVKTLQDENSKLRSDSERLIIRMDKISDERNEAVQQLGRFSVEAEMGRLKIEELQKSVQSMASKLEEQSQLLQKVLLENAQLTLELKASTQLNEKLEADIRDLRQAVSRLESRA